MGLRKEIIERGLHLGARARHHQANDARQREQSLPGATDFWAHGVSLEHCGQAAFILAVIFITVTPFTKIPTWRLIMSSMGRGPCFSEFITGMPRSGPMLSAIERQSGIPWQPVEWPGDQTMRTSSKLLRRFENDAFRPCHGTRARTLAGARSNRGRPCAVTGPR